MLHGDVVSTSSTCNMTASTIPQWLQIVEKKRNGRDEAIRRFLEAQTDASNVRSLSGLCNVLH